MIQENKTEIAIVAFTLVAVAAAGLLIGFILGSKRRKQLVVTEKGELAHVEVD